MDVEQDIKACLGDYENKTGLFEENRFIERTEAIDRIQFHMIDRIDIILSNQPASQDLIPLKNQAENLLKSFESINQTVFLKLRREIRAGDYHNFRSKFSEYAKYLYQNKRAQSIGYDSLDSFVAGLLEVDNGSPEETVSREPDMVFYQPTPAHAIWQLIQESGIRKKDIFYDLGSGLGQVAILVNLLCGAAAKGIEIDPNYCTYARQSAKALSLKGVDFINADARSASYADGTIFYLYTPFQGKILKEVLNRLESESRKRPIKICTYGPCTLDVSKENWLEPVNKNQNSENEVAIFKSISSIPVTTLHVTPFST